MQQVKKRNLWLDLFKLFLAFLVVCVHTVRDTYNQMPLYRLAVPVFFMISGYYLFSKDKDTQLTRAKSFIKRSLIYVIIGSGIYIIFGFLRCIFWKENFATFFNGLFYPDFLFNFFVLNKPISGYEHLWFLVALVVIGLIHYLLVRFNKTKWYYFIVPICLFVKLFFIGYASIIHPGESAYYMYVRNAFFFGLPCFGIGYTMAKFNLNTKSWYKYIYLVLGVGFWLLQMLESRLVVMELYISTIFAGFFLLQFLLGLKSIKCDWYYNWVGKNPAFYIYILHVAVSIIISHYFTLPMNYLYSLLVFGVSLLVYEIGFLIAKLLKFVIAKHHKNNNNQQDNNSDNLQDKNSEDLVKNNQEIL